MNFIRSGQWYETSECGRYTVAASKVNDKFLFQAFKGREVLHTDADPQKCRDACEQHASTLTAGDKRMAFREMDGEEVR